MGTLPVNLPARLTEVKLVEIPLRLRFQPVQDLFLGHRVQLAVTAQTPLPRVDLPKQVKPAQDGKKLPLRIAAVQTVAVRDLLAHQQAAVARQQHTLAPLGQLGQRLVVEVVLIAGVKTQQAQVSRQPPQMNVQQKAQGVGPRRP